MTTTKTDRPAPSPEPTAPRPYTIPRPMLRQSLTFNQDDEIVTVEVLVCSHTDRESYPELQHAGWMATSLDRYDVHVRIVS